jgi:hypothetical protein
MRLQVRDLEALTMGGRLNASWIADSTYRL